MDSMIKDRQYFKFCAYGFLKNLRFFDAFFILFLIEKGLSFTEIGILYASREIFINIFEIPSGIIADTYGRKSSLIGSLFAYILSFCVFYLSGNFWFFMLAFILYGLGDAFRTGTHKGMIMDYLKLNQLQDYKIKYYGYTRSWSQKGSAISSLIAGIIVFYSGSYQNIFLYSVIPYLLNFLLILSYPGELNHSSSQKKADRNRALNITIHSFFKMMKQPKVLKIVNTSALHTAYLRAIKDYIQPLMLNIALIIPIMMSLDHKKKEGLFIGLIYFVIFLLTSYASKKSSKIAAKNKSNISHITLISGFILGILSGILFLYDLWVLSILAFIGIYIIENIRKPILTGFIADSVPNEILTSVISAQSLLRTILTALLALTFGVIADHFGIGLSLAVVSLTLIILTLILNLFTLQYKSKA